MSLVRPVVRIVCWNREIAGERARLIAKAGLEVDATPFPSAQAIGHLRERSPNVVLIDLDKLPSHGRDVAIVIRASKSTRHIPIVFAGGAEEKVARVRSDIPEGVFTAWKNAAREVKRAAKSAASAPADARPYMRRWAGSALTKKLGFKEGLKVALLHAPDGFEETLGDLPADLQIKTAIAKDTQLALWFVRSRAELESEIEFMVARAPQGCSLWICSPKQTSRSRSDFNQNDVRSAALAVGWVDYKVCSVDNDWSGLKFARRRT